MVEALEAAEPGLRKGNPWDAGLITAVERAEAQLNGGLVGQHLRQRVVQLRKDVDILAKIERIRLSRGEVRDGHFHFEGSHLQYARAFREYGIDVETLGGGGGGRSGAGLGDPRTSGGRARRLDRCAVERRPEAGSEGETAGHCQAGGPGPVDESAARYEAVRGYQRSGTTGPVGTGRGTTQSRTGTVGT